MAKFEHDYNFHSYFCTALQKNPKNKSHFLKTNDTFSEARKFALNKKRKIKKRKLVLRTNDRKFTLKWKFNFDKKREWKIKEKPACNIHKSPPAPLFGRGSQGLRNSNFLRERPADQRTKSPKTSFWQLPEEMDLSNYSSRSCYLSLV